jgi:hypothetical protein
VLFDYRANISSLLSLSSLDIGLPDVSFFNSLTRSAYLSVFNVCSQQLDAGEMLAIIVVLELPTNESFKT